MTLKNTRLARAEDLSSEIRAEYNLPEKGLIIIESHNQDLREKFVSAGEGIRKYLLTLGKFKEVQIE